MAKRISLRDFQESLSARLQSAKRGETAVPLLGVYSGGRHWLLELPDSGEVIPLPSLTTVPLTQPWFAGMANIRGGLHAVIDWASFIGGIPTPRNERSRLLLVGARYNINSGLLVERILGLRPVSTLKPTALPDDCPGVEWVSAAFVDDTGQEWLQLSLGKLLADPVFLDIGL